MKEKIALLVPHLGGGGAERMMANLTKGFADFGYPVDLVLFSKSGGHLEKIPGSVNIIDLKVNRAMNSIGRISGYLKEYKPYAMISTLSRVNVAAVIGRMISGAKTKIILREANTFSVYTDGTPARMDKIIYKAAKIFYPFGDKIVAVSRGVADDLIENFNFGRDKVSVIYNPVVDEEIWDKKAEEPDHPWLKEKTLPVVLGVGRITKQKDFVTLLKAFNELQKGMRSRLIILGSGKNEEGGDRNEYEILLSLVEEFGIKEKVSLPGYVKNPFAYMARADLFVLSSRWEGLPGVLIQALACGSPVVSTRCPSGPDEILEEGKYGELVGIGDHAAMAEAMRKSLSREHDKDLLVNRAKEFSVENSVRKYIELIER